MPQTFKTVFTCSKCDAQSPKWSGRCFECGEWGGLREAQAELKTQNAKRTNKENLFNLPASTKVQNLETVTQTNIQRTKTNINELDKVLGGGIVPGSLILLGGEPGIGKSTLLLQVASNILPEQAKRVEGPSTSASGLRSSNNTILYVSGEESAEQLKNRFDRLKLAARNVQYLGETNTESICGTIASLRPALAIVDSIQMLTSNDSKSDPGSMSQIKIATAMLATVAREMQIPIIIVGHVTKDGGLAGPKTLEHLVDIVLEFSGDRGGDVRILRAIKNRFGQTGELAFFEMGNAGLSEVVDPSRLLLAGKVDAPGSIVAMVLEGSRPLAVEVQALLNRTNFGYPKRQAVGFDLNKLQLLAAVISKRTNVNLNYFDAHLKIVGGFKITEPGADLPAALAMLSAFRNIALPQNTVALGEIGLTGEIRAVPQMEKRLHEAERLGFTEAIVPPGMIKNTKLKLIQIKNIVELLNLF